MLVTHPEYGSKNIDEAYKEKFVSLGWEVVRSVAEIEAELRAEIKAEIEQETVKTRGRPRKF